MTNMMCKYDDKILVMLPSLAVKLGKILFK